MRFVARSIAVATTSLLLIGLVPGLAQAATPAKTGSTPAASSNVNTLTSISITFDTALAPTSTITVTSSPTQSGLQCTATTSGSTLSCTPQNVPSAPLGQGLYTVNYSARSNTPTDPAATGTFSFTYDTTPPAAPTSSAISPNPYRASSTGPITVSGISEKAGDTVHVVLSSTGGGSALSQNVTAGTGGAFSAPFSAPIADGTLTASITSTDAAGNVQTAPAATASSVKDTAAPTVSSTLPVDGGAMKSVGASFLVNANEPLGVTSTVLITDATSTSLATTQTFPTASSLRVTPVDILPEGSYTAALTLVDAVGNSRTTSQTFRIDDTVPVAPAISARPVVNIGNVASYTISGTGEAGANVVVTVTDGTTSANFSTSVPAASTAWSLANSLAAFNQGTLTFTAKQTDAAGNVSPFSAPATATKDTIAPRVTGQAFDKATYNASAPAVITGKVDNGSSTAGEPDPVSVSINDTDPATAPKVGTGTAAADGTFSISISLTGLSDTTLTATVTATDSAANPSLLVTATANHDTVAPRVTAQQFDQPVYNAARITSSPNATITGKVDNGTTTGGEADAVSVSVDDADPLTAPITATGVATGTGLFSIPVDIHTLSDGTLTLTVSATDGSVNTSAPATATATKDVLAPTQPTMTVPTFLTTSNAAISGTAEAGSSLRVTATDSTTPTANTATVTLTVPGSGNWSTTVPVGTFAQGTVTFVATATDAAGNASPTQTKTSTKDTVAPGAPATVVASPSPYTYRDTTLTVSGTDAVADRAVGTLVADITISDTSGATADLVHTDVPVAVTTGAFSNSFTQAEALTQDEGTLTVSVKIRDLAGNSSAALTATAVKDVTHLALVSSTPSGAVNTAPAVVVVYNEGLNTNTSSASPPYSKITVKNKNGLTVGGTLAFSNGGKTLTFTPSSPFSESGSPFAVTTHATDVNDAGDSPTDGSFSFTLDSTAPVAPVISSVTDPVNAANSGAAAVSGNATESGLSVTVTVAGTAGSVSGTTTSGTGGAFTVSGLNLAGLPDGPLSATAVSTDAATNISPTSAAVAATKDTVGPVQSSASPANRSTVRPPSTVSITFNEPLAISSTISVAGVTGTSSVSGATVTFTPSAALSDGPYTANAAVTDLSGNSSTGSSTFAVDGTGPTVGGLAATPTTSGAQSSTVTGSTENGATVALSATDGTHTVTGSTTAGATGFSATLDLSTLNTGTVSFSVVATDTLGNPGPAAATTAGRDTVAPSVSGLAATNTTAGVPNSTVSGTTGEAGDSVLLVVTDGTHTVSTTVSSTGVTGAFTGSLNTASLNEGALTASATATDAAPPVGNTGSAATTGLSRDSVGAAVTNLAASNVSIANPATHITGTTEPGASVALSATDGSTSVSGIGVVAAGGGFTGNLDLSSLADGVLTVTASGTDSKGNPGTPVSVQISKDSVAPVVSGLSASSTSIATPSSTVTGSRTGPASLVVTWTDAGAVHSVTSSVTSGSGAFSASRDLSTLNDGVITVTVVATDAAGNTGSASGSAAKDATAPVVSGLTASSTSIGSPSSTVTGSRSESSSVVVTWTDAGAVHSVTSSVAAGTTPFSASGDLSSLNDGVITVTAVATDAAGNTGSASASAAKDATAPVVSGLTASSTSIGSPSSTVTGSRSESSSVVVTWADAGAVHSVTSSVAAGTTPFSASSDLSTLDDGVITVTVVATDAAGNTGSGSASAGKDTVAPAVTGLTATSTNVGSPSSTVTGSRSESSSVVVTWTDAGAVHSVTSSVAAGTTPFSASRDLSTLNDGVITVSVVATDPAGNAGSAATTSAGKDSVAPTVSGLAASASTFGTPASTITGVVSESSAVALSATDGVHVVTGSATVNPDKSFSGNLDLSGMANGPVTVTVTATDTAGNVGPSGSIGTTRSSAKPVPSLTLGAPAKTLAGQPFGIYGSLLRRDTSVAAALVTIHVKTDDGVVRTAGTVAPNSLGNYVFHVAPTGNSTYWATYPGDSRNGLATSSSHRTLVAARVVLTSPLTGSRGAATTPLVVRGSVSPNKSGRVVTLYKVLSGGTLQALRTAVLTSTSTYAFTISLPRGTYTLQVGIPVTLGNTAGYIRFTNTRT